jgi:hypothetical protein
MLNQIHQLLARRLVQKEEQPKANKFQFSTGFRVVSARAFAGTGRLLVMAISCKLRPWQVSPFRTAEDFPIENSPAVF